MVWFLWVLLLAAGWAQEDTRFEVFLRKTDNNAKSGAVVYIVHMATSDSLQLTEVVGKPGLYRRENVPFGLYKIYVDGSLNTTSRFFATNRIYDTITTIDPDGNNQVDTGGIEDGAVTAAKIDTADIAAALAEGYVDGGGTIYYFFQETEGNQSGNYFTDINHQSSTFLGGAPSAGTDNVFANTSGEVASTGIVAATANFPNRTHVAKFVTKSSRTTGLITNFRFLKSGLSTSDVVSMAVKISASKAVTTMRVYFYAVNSDNSTQSLGNQIQSVSAGGVAQFEIENKTITLGDPIGFQVGVWENDLETDCEIHFGDLSINSGAAAVLERLEATYVPVSIGGARPNTNGLINLKSDTSLVFRASGNTLSAEIKPFYGDSNSVAVEGQIILDSTSRGDMYVRAYGVNKKLLAPYTEVLNNITNYRGYSGNDPTFNDAATYHLKDHSWNYTAAQTDAASMVAPPAHGFNPTLEQVLKLEMGASRSFTTLGRYTSTIKDAWLAPGDTVSFYCQISSSSTGSVTVRLYSKQDSLNNGSNITQLGFQTKTVTANTMQTFAIEDVVIPASAEIFYLFFYDQNQTNIDHWIGNMTLVKGATVVTNIPQASFVRRVNGIIDQQDLTIEGGGDVAVSTDISQGKITISATTSGGGGAAANNLLYDPTFSRGTGWLADDAYEWYFWDKAESGDGAISQQIDAEEMGPYIPLIETNSSGSGTDLYQKLWFWDHPEIFPGDSLHFSVWVKGSAAGAVRLYMQFLDRSESGTTYNSGNNGGTSWEKLTVAQPIPADHFGAKLGIEVIANSRTAEVAKPFAGTSPAVTWADNPENFERYAFAQNLARKLRRGENVNYHAWGNSITHGGDTYATHDGGSYSSWIKDLIDEKFGVTSIKKNFGSDGAFEEKTMFLMRAFSLDESPDLISLADGRNRQTPSFDDYYGNDSTRLKFYESTIRMIKSKEPDCDIFLFMPAPQKLGGTSPVLDNFYNDQIFRAQNRELASLYGLGLINPYDNVVSLANRGLVDWDLWYGTAGTSEVTHPQQIWRRMIQHEFRKVLAGSFYNVRYTGFDLPTYRLMPKGADLDSLYFISSDSSALTYYGTWNTTDPLASISNGAISWSVGGAALGEFTATRTSTAQNDSVTFDFVGTQMAILFVTGAGRGVADIFIDGVEYNFNTASVSAGMFSQFRTYWDDAAAASPILLSNGPHHVRIVAADANAIGIIGVITN